MPDRIRYEITTDDLIVLRTISAQLDDLKKDFGELKMEVKESDRRLRRIERAHPGGLIGKQIERAVLALLTALLGWQQISSVSKAPEPAPPIVQPATRPVGMK